VQLNLVPVSLNQAWSFSPGPWFGPNQPSAHLFEASNPLAEASDGLDEAWSRPLEASGRENHAWFKLN
ncbi:MAG TPA: hypothetical protein VD793_01460, partial [Gemmatimonadales bacterium]|nr:hypothetical protein [Gemmatimonadales bacterium]